MASRNYSRQKYSREALKKCRSSLNATVPSIYFSWSVSFTICISLPTILATVSPTSRMGHVNLFRARATGTKRSAQLSTDLSKLDRHTVLDGEIVILDSEGRSQFYELMRRRAGAVFYAFDCLALDGEDLRTLPLLERKQRLKALIRGMNCILFATHIERSGESFFRMICDQDLEGVVAKRRDDCLRRGMVQDPQSSIFAVRGQARFV